MNSRTLKSERRIVIALVAVLLLLGVLLGSVAQLPFSVSLVAAAVIAGWLAVFAVREQLARHRSE